MNQDRRGERESGESEPHFYGLPTEGSHIEMAFGPLTRLEPLLVDAMAARQLRAASRRARQCFVDSLSGPAKAGRHTHRHLFGVELPPGVEIVVVQQRVEHHEVAADR